MQDLKRKPKRIKNSPSSNPSSTPEFWFKDCKTDEDRKAKQSRLLSAKGILEELKTYADNRFSEAARVTSKNYDNAGWACEQAHRNGQMEAYEEIWRLLP